MPSESPLPTTLPLESSRLRLRRFIAADLPAFQAYRTDPEIARYQGWESCTQAEAQQFLVGQQQAIYGMPGHECQIAIERKARPGLIGDCYLKVDKDEPRLATLGFSLAREFQGRGYATEAVSRLLDDLFGARGLHRVIAYLNSENVRSRALLERVGFRREGHYLQCYWKNGRWEDAYSYALLEREWEAKQQVE